MRVDHLEVPGTILFLEEMPDKRLAHFLSFIEEAAMGIEKAIPCARIGVAVLGLEVPHAHIHLVPMNTMSDLNFKNPKLKFTPEEFTKIARKISEKVKL